MKKIIFFFVLAIFLISAFSKPDYALALCIPTQCDPGHCDPPLCDTCSWCPSVVIGRVTPPPGVSTYGNLLGGGLIGFAGNIIRLLVVIAGLYAFFNLIIAGYGFMSAGGDPKKVEEAWAKIWQSLIGLLIILGSFVLAAIFGYMLFGDATAILRPKIYGP